MTETNINLGGIEIPSHQPCTKEEASEIISYYTEVVPPMGAKDEQALEICGCVLANTSIQSC